MGPRSPKQRIGPDRRPEVLPEPFPAAPAAHCRPQKAKKPRQDAALQTPGRTDPRQTAHQQSQVETRHVDQQSLPDIGVAPDEDAAQPARGELMPRTAAPPTRSAAAATAVPGGPESVSDSRTPVPNTSGSSPSSCVGPNPSPTSSAVIPVPSTPAPSRCCGIPCPPPLP